MNTKPFAVAIDGPAGVGKSTTAKEVAKTLGMKYVDTGSMYRAIALYCIKNNIDPKDETAVAAILSNIEITLLPGQILLNGEDVTKDIRDRLVTDVSSIVSPYPAVRAKLAAKQKEIVATYETVMDGRDIGSHVIPWAQVKIYLDADVEIRAARRAIELEKDGKPVDMKNLCLEIAERDHRDKTRKHSPLVKAEDAIYIDTGNFTKDEVVAQIIAHINATRR